MPAMVVSFEHAALQRACIAALAALLLRSAIAEAAHGSQPLATTANQYDLPVASSADYYVPKRLVFPVPRLPPISKPPDENSVGIAALSARPLPCHDSACSGHGRCLNGLCECETLWAGVSCEYTVEAYSDHFDMTSASPGAAPAPGWLASPGAFLPASSEPLDTFALGTSLPASVLPVGETPFGQAQAPAPGKADYLTTLLITQACADRNYCSQHGRCDAGLCRCDAGWTGNDCASQAQCPENCNSPSGQCVLGLCVCEQGFHGASCSERVCLNDCWGHGSCSDGHCACSAGWTGSECDKQEMQTLSLAAFIGEKPLPPLPEIKPISLIEVTPQRPAGLVGNAASNATSLIEAAAYHKTVPGSGRHIKLTPSLSSAIKAAGSAMSAASAVEQAATALAALQSSAHEPVAASELVATSLDRSAMLLKELQMGKTVDPFQTPRLVGNALGSRPQQEQPLAPAAAPAPAGAMSAPGMIEGPPALEPGQCLEGCSGHGACVESECQCSSGWTGEACDIAPCPMECNNRGSCLNGACICNEEFYGVSCEHNRCPQDCSGNGNCDSGRCVCNPKWFGPDCSVQMSVTQAPTLVKSPDAPPPAHLRSALAGYRAVAPKSCPDNCNEQGRCDENGECICFAGYTGNACQDFCPNLCSGQGSCNQGECLCNAGFGGVDCSVKICCSGHGDCSLPDMCVCNVGWLGDQCQIPMQCPEPTCSGHGNCKSGTCTCTAGWDGSKCDTPPKECGQCPPGAQCDRTTGECLCDGQPCQEQPGKKAKKAAGSELPSLPLGGGGGGGAAGAAGAAGTTEAESTSASGSTTILGPGPAPAPGPSPAAGPVAGVIVPPPSCNEPHGFWNATTIACQCTSPIWYGQHCEKQHCPDWNQTSGSPDCGGHGMCVNGQCLCVNGWGQKKGSAGPNVCADEVCPVDCGDHGMCSNGVCICQEGWQGPACREPQCMNDCSGRGQCTFTAPNSPPECICEYGFALPDCNEESLYTELQACPSDCSGNGLCMNGECVCSDKWTGLDCSHPICPRGKSGPGCKYEACPRDCTGNGLCFNGECSCNYNYLGPDCSIPTRCYEACSEVCLPDLASSKCEFCKGQCITLVNNPVVGHHNPFIDTLSTLQKSSKQHVGRGERLQVHQKPKHRRFRHGHHVEVQVTTV